MHIIGHDPIRKMLGKMATGGLSHRAFLFFGPEGVGKTLVAKEFAGRLLDIPDDDPTGHQDFLLLSPERKKNGKGSISVEAVREAGVFLSRFPAQAHLRVIVVEGADFLSESGQNALLKIFEEPNRTSVLILVASRRGKLRDTIFSRAFRVEFSLVPESVLSDGAKKYFPSEKLKDLEPFFFSLGRPALVVSALEDSDRFSEKRELLRNLFSLSKLSISERLSLSERLSDESLPDVPTLLEWWVAGLRSMRRDEKDERTLSRYYGFLEKIEESVRMLRDTNANPRLVLDRLLLSFA